MNYEPNRDGSANALGYAEFAPSAGADSGGLIVTYRPTKPGDVQLYEQCQPLLTECETLTLPDGSVVVTHVLGPPFDGVPGQDQGPAVAAYRIVGDNVVALLAGAPGKDTDAVLTRDQLVDVISGPEWANLKPAG